MEKKRLSTEFIKSKDAKKTCTLASCLIFEVRAASLHLKNIKFYLCSCINMHIPVLKSNKVSKIRFTNFSNINNMHLIDLPGDEDYFFHIIFFLARLNG